MNSNPTATTATTATANSAGSVICVLPRDFDPAKVVVTPPRRSLYGKGSEVDILYGEHRQKLALQLGTTDDPLYTPSGPEVWKSAENRFVPVGKDVNAILSSKSFSNYITGKANLKLRLEHYDVPGTQSSDIYAAFQRLNEVLIDCLMNGSTPMQLGDGEAPEPTDTVLEDGRVRRKLWDYDLTLSLAQKVLHSVVEHDSPDYDPKFRAKMRYRVLEGDQMARWSQDGKQVQRTSEELAKLRMSFAASAETTVEPFASAGGVDAVDLIRKGSSGAWIVEVQPLSLVDLKCYVTCELLKARIVRLPSSAMGDAAGAAHSGVMFAEDVANSRGCAPSVVATDSDSVENPAKRQRVV